MTTPTVVDRYLERVTAGDSLTPDEVRALASTSDVLAIGMLADAAKRRFHGRQTTFLRVADYPLTPPGEQTVLPAAKEVRVIGTPDTLAAAVDGVRRARALAGGRTVSAFSWTDVERMTPEGPARDAALGQLRSAGLDALAELPLDQLGDAEDVVARLVHAGFRQLRLTVSKPWAGGREELFFRADRLQQRFGCIQSLGPLPLTLGAFRPTTGYEDVKAVALARLAAPQVPSIQVDWRRYGPKLAQVALTFGADDIDGVSASDEAPEGRRRQALEEIRRNIEAAGFEAVERDGRFAVAS
jgi:aminodeoxyfutalosine synthase